MSGGETTAKIPRPRSEKAARNNPGRWVCNIRPEKCNGIFYVYGQAWLCPLREKCLQGTKTIYEWTWGGKYRGNYPQMSKYQLERNRIHRNERPFYDRLWGNRGTAYSRMSPEQKKRQAERNRKWRAKKKKDAPPEKGKERWILPCGEDCENCPFEECKYTDEKEDALEREEEQEYHRRAARESYYRKKAEMEKDPELAEAYKRRKKEDMQRFLERKDEKMKSDPEFREQEKEKARVKARKYYHETYKEKMRSDPEFREKERVKQHNRGKKYYESHKEKVLARQKANYEKCKEKRRQQAQPEDNIKNKEENDHGQ